MNTAEIITAIVGVGGLGVILPKIIEVIRAWQSGKAVREKAENKSLLQRLMSAEARADMEASFRRQFEDYAGLLRVMLVRMGVPAKDLPPWPERTKDKVS
jgi:hypothetical protein